MFVMVDVSRFELHPVNPRVGGTLEITQLPYCWHITTHNKEWAIIVCFSIRDNGQTDWSLCMAQKDTELTECYQGGGRTREVAVHLASRINELVESVQGREVA